MDFADVKPKSARSSKKGEVDDQTMKAKMLKEQRLVILISDDLILLTEKVQ